MDAQILIYIIILIILIALSAVFSSTETALSSINVIKLRKQAIKNKRAKKAYKLTQNYSKALTTILVFNNIVNTASAAIATFLFSKYLGEIGVLYATIIMTVLVLIFGEISPKIIAKENSEKVLLMVAPSICFLVIVLTPITYLVARLERMFMKNKKKGVTASESELLDIVQTIEFEGVLNQDERELIENAIKFDDKRVRDIMLGREEVICIDINASSNTIKEIIKNYKYSRIPIIDSKNDEIVGILHESDVVELLVDNKPINLKKIMRPVLYLYHGRRLPLALEKMQKERVHMAIVVDKLETKNFIGIVTLEDIIEQLVGEIYDEYDDLPKYVVEVGLHSYEVDPNISVKKFIDEYLDNTNLPQSKAKTFIGFIKELKPEGVRQGEELVYDNIKIKIDKIENGVITSLDITEFSKFDNLG